MIKIRRSENIIEPSCRRVLLRPFQVGDTKRIQRILDAILALSQDEVAQELQAVRMEFGGRHQRIEQFWLQQYEHRRAAMKAGEHSTARKLLIGAHFTMEYSLESAALFNPSMVWHPDQSDVPPGSRRFILSLRATGEGHISSITFRTGLVSAEGATSVDKPTLFAKAQKVQGSDETGYEAVFPSESLLCERVIFPSSSQESNGIEDARFTEFKSEAGGVTYFATYTAYDGAAIYPRLLETSDFLHFKVRTLAGAEAYNKGMALFPRKVNGRYAMLSRQDNENNFIMFSDKPDVWSQKQLLDSPQVGWERIQLGNCGAPIETEAGWLVLTHGVGAMRKYAIGALLLDLEDPTKVVAKLREPLINPNESERDGYVPNVVYSCGGQIHRGKLVIPYAMSDSASTFATVDLHELISGLRSGHPS